MKQNMDDLIEELRRLGVEASGIADAVDRRANKESGTAYGSILSRGLERILAEAILALPPLLTALKEQNNG